jgi:hypothetical protein
MPSSRYTGEDATLRGWLLWDPRHSAGNLNSATAFGVPSEGGPHAGGVGTPARADTAAVVEATGEQSAELRIETLQTGLPRVSRGMRVGYRFGSENPDRMRGWQPPNFVTGCVPIEATTVAAVALSLVALRTGDLVCAYRRNGTELSIRTFNVGTLTWSATLTAPAIVGGSSDVTGPVALTVDTQGYVYLLVNQVQGWTLWRTSSPDTLADGWIEAARVGFNTYSPNSASERLRLFVQPNGDLALFEFRATNPGGYIRQYASSDGGSTFVRIDETANVTTNLSDAIQLPSGRLGVMRVNASSAVLWSSSGSAWAAACNSATVSVTTTAFESWLGYDPVGRIYAWIRDDENAGALLLANSDDDGASWGLWVHGVNDYDADTGQGPSKGQAAHSGGAFYLLHASYDTAATYDDSPILTRLGGWSSHVWIGGQAAIYDSSYDARMLGSGIDLQGDWAGASWLPPHEPDDLACWTAGGSGTDAEDSILTSGRLQFSCNGINRYMSATIPPRVPPDPPDTRAIIDFQMSVTVGGLTTGTISGCTLVLSDGATAVVISIAASTTAFAVRDHASALATVTVDMTSMMQFRVAIMRGVGTNATAEVYYKRPTETYWTQAYSANSWLTTAIATGLFRWGIVGTGAFTTTCQFAYMNVKFTALSDAYPNLYGSRASSILTSEYLVGRQLTGAPAAIYDRATAGLKQTYLAALDGPATGADTWSIPPAYDYPSKNALPDVQPSPRRPWRSATDNTTESFAWMQTQKTSISRHYGFAVFGANWRTARLEGYNATTTTWTTIGTMDLASGRTGLGWARTGDTLRPNANDTTRYIWRGELVGATVDLGGGKLRRVRSHTEGVWSTAAAKHAEIVLESIDGTEGATGTMDVWARSGVLVCMDQGTLFDGWRVVIEPQQTVDDYYEIGTLIPPGPLVAAGQSHGWGGSVTHEPSAVSTRSADFVSRTRRLGPSARTWSWSWPDGIDQSRLMDSPPRPDFLATSAGTEGIANLNDAPYLVAGLLEDIASGARPLVAMEYIPSTNGTTLTDSRLFMLCRIASTIGLEHIQGDPERDAVWRISPITMQEIV